MDVLGVRMMVDRTEAENAVRTLLQYLESDPDREVLLKTPKRVIDSWDEIFSGYTTNAETILKATFNAEGYDGIVLLSNIEFHSTCEHHLQPFSGKAHVAYIPVERIVGISKLARIVDHHALRLQNQERITNNVANDLVEHLNPLGAAVIIQHPMDVCVPWSSKTKRNYDDERYTWSILRQARSPQRTNATD